ncbi:hypothetical protein LOK49_LG03G01948 [Camellia lanceoleosa]|uniref:Uncharacterized protein n=1 Tax=Camellia lanceoleosa TaxID=1840588 RepID=A0ACC0IHV7_9ERIC|nr:hypothetical protein LOK49_LG03G01948 [Camellia lanceoleosa]
MPLFSLFNPLLQPFSTLIFNPHQIEAVAPIKSSKHTFGHQRSPQSSMLHGFPSSSMVTDEEAQSLNKRQYRCF